MLEKTMRLNYLFDFYQGLLTPKQQEYMTMYYLEDLSLVEIAHLSKVSRQAVYDNIKRTEAILNTYEEKLFLYQKYEKRIILLAEIKEIVADHDHSNKLNDVIDQLQELG